MINWFHECAYFIQYFSVTSWVALLAWPVSIVQTVLYPIAKAILPTGRLTKHVISKAENWGRFFYDPPVVSTKIPRYLCTVCSIQRLTINVLKWPTKTPNGTPKLHSTTECVHLFTDNTYRVQSAYQVSHSNKKLSCRRDRATLRVIEIFC